MFLCMRKRLTFCWFLLVGWRFRTTSSTVWECVSFDANAVWKNSTHAHRIDGRKPGLTNLWPYSIVLLYHRIGRCAGIVPVVPVEEFWKLQSAAHTGHRSSNSGTRTCFGAVVSPCTGIAIHTQHSSQHLPSREAAIMLLIARSSYSSSLQHEKI